MKPGWGGRPLPQAVAGPLDAQCQVLAPKGPSAHCLNPVPVPGGRLLSTWAAWTLLSQDAVFRERG